MQNRTHKFLSLFLAITLALGSITLVGCGGGGQAEQDNCYGEDMPVVNE